MRPLLVGLGLLAASAVSAQSTVTLAPPSLPADARFGAAVVVSRETQAAPNNVVVAVGAPGGTYEAPPAHPGTAFAYVGRQWDAPRTFLSPDPQPGDLFGFSIDRNGWEFSGYLIGAPGDDAAYHFHTSVSSSPDYVTRLDGSSAGAGSGFGYTVAGLGGSLVVGAPYATGGGAVLTFGEYSPPGVPASIEPVQTLRPSVATDTRFGASVSAGYASNYGPYAQRLIIGAPGTNGSDGAVYVFRLDAAGQWLEETRLTGPPGFGTHVAIHPQRRSPALFAASVPGTDSAPGAVYVYKNAPATGWTPILVHAGDGPRSPGSLAMAAVSSSWYFLTGAPSALGGATPLPVDVYGWNAFDVPVAAEISSPPEASPAFGAALSYTPILWAVGDPGRGSGTVMLGTAELVPVASEDGPSPLALRLSPPVPNPTAGAATVSLTLPAAADVRVALYDALGREVAVVQEGPLSPGTHALPLDMVALPPGVYVLRAATPGAVVTERLTVVR